MRPYNPPKGIIFDLGDVLFTWSPSTATKVPAEMMRVILSSAIWIKHECGFVEQAECYHQIAQEFSIPASGVAEAFSQARHSLQPNYSMLSYIHNLKHKLQGRTKFYVMSNISKEDYGVLATKLSDWSVFDRIFTSGHAGMRKPDLVFYRHVLEEIQLSPEDTLLVDDKIENVSAAISLGMDGIIFNNTSSVIDSLQIILDSHTGRAFQYLYCHAGHFDSVTDTGVCVPDNFAHLLILESLGDKNLVDIKWESFRTWNYFRGSPVLVPGGYFPDDLDTTSMALTILRPDADLVTSLLDEMLTYLHPDGMFQTYFDRSRPRTDPVVSANVLTCFYTFDRGHSPGLERTVQSIRTLLLSREHLQGTRYYPSSDCCLFFFGRLLRSSNDKYLQKILAPVLKERIQERVGQSGSALDIATRILVCKWLELDYGDDCQTLLNMQCEDGGWEAGWMYRYGSTGVKLGNRGVTTAIAIKALEHWDRNPGATGINSNCTQNGLNEGSR